MNASRYEDSDDEHDDGDGDDDEFLCNRKHDEGFIHRLLARIQEVLKESSRSKRLL